MKDKQYLHTFRKTYSVDNYTRQTATAHFIDNLPNDQSMYMGILTIGSDFLTLIQKYGFETYASYIQFTYLQNMYYRCKTSGQWRDEITIAQ